MILTWTASGAGGHAGERVCSRAGAEATGVGVRGAALPSARFPGRSRGWTLHPAVCLEALAEPRPSRRCPRWTVPGSSGPHGIRSGRLLLAGWWAPWGGAVSAWGQGA